MTEFIILIDGPKKDAPERKKSIQMTPDFEGVNIGTSKLPIKETGGKLDLSSNPILIPASTDENSPIPKSELDAEALARSNADGTLQDNIDAEALARTNADGTLQDNIDAEALARSNADGTLQDNIDAEALARTNADGTLQDNIDAEALARTNADGTLQDNIDAEALARTNADNDLHDALDAIAANNPNYQAVVSTEGQTDFDFSPLTFDPSSLVLDVIVLVDGRWNIPIENFLKLDDHTIRLDEAVAAGKQVVAWKQGTSSGGSGGGTDLQNITVNLGFTTPKTIGVLAKPASSLIVKDKANTDVWEIEVNAGVLQAVKISP